MLYTSTEVIGQTAGFTNEYRIVYYLFIGVSGDSKIHSIFKMTQVVAEVKWNKGLYNISTPPLQQIVLLMYALFVPLLIYNTQYFKAAGLILK